MESVEPRDEKHQLLVAVVLAVFILNVTEAEVVQDKACKGGLLAKPLEIDRTTRGGWDGDAACMTFVETECEDLGVGNRRVDRCCFHVLWELWTDQGVEFSHGGYARLVEVDFTRGEGVESVHDGGYGSHDVIGSVWERERERGKVETG